MTAPFQQERYQSDRLTFERQQFEDKVYLDHFCRCLHDSLSKAELCARNDINDYKRKEISAMWHGWKLAKGLL